jgi:hypothetical protein
MSICIALLIGAITQVNPNPILALALGAVYLYHCYYLYVLIGYNSILTYMLPPFTLIIALFLGAWSFLMSKIYYVLVPFN